VQGGGRCRRHRSIFTKPAPRTMIPTKLRALHSFDPPAPTRHCIAPPHQRALGERRRYLSFPYPPAAGVADEPSVAWL
jgi:hypothetical protein